MGTIQYNSGVVNGKERTIADIGDSIAKRGQKRLGSGRGRSNRKRSEWKSEMVKRVRKGNRNPERTAALPSFDGEAEGAGAKGVPFVN